MVRCVRRKCVKGVARMTAKVKEAQDNAAAGRTSRAKGEGVDEWPFTATIGDALRASVVASGAAGIRRAWERIRDSDAWTVVRLKNKFRAAKGMLARAQGNTSYAAELREGAKGAQFANLHINVLFRAGDGFAPIVAEIQVHHREMLELSKSGHKLYEVIRAGSIAALAGKGATLVVAQGGTAALEAENKAQADEIAQLRKELQRQTHEAKERETD